MYQYTANGECSSTVSGTYFGRQLGSASAALMHTYSAGETMNWIVSHMAAADGVMLGLISHVTINYKGQVCLFHWCG